MFLVHEGYYVFGMDALVILFIHERDYGLGMDALVTACSWNTNAPPPPPHPAPEVAETAENTRQTMYTPPPTCPVSRSFRA